MIDKDARGEIHLFYEPKIDSYSNTALGLIIRAIHHGIRIGYVDLSDKSSKLNNFFENLSLSHYFVKNFRKIHLEIFSFKSNGKISKSIIPQVEFYTINEQIFLKSISDFDFVIFDSYSSEVLKKFTLLNILSNKQPHQEYFIITSNEKDAKDLEPNVNNSYSYVESKKKTLTSSKESIITVTGSKTNSTLYSIAHMVRNFINKNDVKYIGFDRGDDIYGENAFFSALKKWNKEHELYGTFDYVNTGVRRYFEKGYRDEIYPEDTKEAKEGLSLLDTALRKQSPIISDGIIDIVNKDIIKYEDLKKVLGKVKNELILTGEVENKDINSISTKTIHIKTNKKSKSKLLRRGFDY